MSVHVEYMEARYMQVEYIDERNLKDVVEDVEKRDVLVFADFGGMIVFSGPRDELLAKFQAAIGVIEAGAPLYEDPDLQCGECGRFFDALEDLEAHEAELAD